MSATASPSDEELARRAQEGCAASLDELLRRYQTPVLHFLRHRGFSADAEDLLQETLVRAVGGLERYRPQWRFATWVFTIARRVGLNHRRRRRPATDDSAVCAAPSPSPGPLEEAIEGDRRRRLWTIVGQALAEDEQTAMWLHYVEGMPAGEIAAVLGRSRVAVKTLMFRARKKLLPLVEGLEAEVSHG
jgi:RNA polymerase sigma-70 factor (ECF subfamily)